MTKPSPKPQEEPDGPAIVTPMHKQDRLLSPVAGAPKGYRRIDRLQWLRDHNAIADHQLFAGRRLQDDWQLSKLESSPQMQMARGGGAATTNLSDAKCDAIDRLKRALAKLPPEIETILSLFLLPEDEPFSLERCARLVREDPKAARFAIRTGLSILARHYGYST